MESKLLTEDIVLQIRTARSAWVPWAQIAKRLGLSVAECRKAIEVPSLSPIPVQNNESSMFADLVDDYPEVH